MERYYGFDLGDAESALARLRKEDTGQPEILTVADAPSFITAYARLSDGQILIGEEACYGGEASERRLRFKSRFLTDASGAADVRVFAKGVLEKLRSAGGPEDEDSSCFYIGCPAGWDKTARERYRRIFEELGYPPARIVSESRAALVAACQSRHFQVGYDIMSRPVLVVDIGSSTTDFAYICSGREVELKTAGEVALGGGILDELLLRRSVAALPEASRGEITRVLEESSAWYSYCEFAARRLKEKYFTDEDYWAGEGCSRTLRLLWDRPLKLPLHITRSDADAMLEEGTEKLGGKSFRATFTESLKEIRGKIGEQLPELLFLTGGMSRMQRIREWCAEVFPEAVVITGTEPEFSVARGLSWSGRIDEELREFRAEVRDLIDSTAVEQIVDSHIEDLYRRTVDTMVEPILRSAALPVFDRWRSGEIRRLCDIDDELRTEIEAYLRSDEARAKLTGVVTQWMKPVAYAVEEHTMPICLRHGVPYRSLSLSSGLELSELEVRVDAREVVALEQFTWMINAIISLLVGCLCGGSGIALITGGLPGILAGVMISLVVLLLGKEKLQEALLSADIPVLMRRLVPRSRLEARLGKLSDEVKADFFDRLEHEKNEEITGRLSAEITAQIEQYLSKMAEIVEIPLG